MRNITSTIIILILVGIIAFLSWKMVQGAKPLSPAPATATTTPVVEASPAISPDAPLSARVVVDTPQKNSAVSQSFTISGSAPGPWYFEASFPIQIRDAENTLIGRGIAQAQGEWMTENLVPFTATVSIEGGYHGPADMVLLRDNPSGLPENDDSVTIPIRIE